MWYYESLANQWPAPPWATDSQRFATCTVITVQFLHCTIINRNPYSERFPYRTCFSRFDLALPFLRTAQHVVGNRLCVALHQSEWYSTGAWAWPQAPAAQEPAFSLSTHVPLFFLLPANPKLRLAAPEVKQVKLVPLQYLPKTLTPHAAMPRNHF